jgi:hypothetical protein
MQMTEWKKIVIAKEVKQSHEIAMPAYRNATSACRHVAYAPRNDSHL